MTRLPFAPRSASPTKASGRRWPNDAAPRELRSRPQAGTLWSMLNRSAPEGKELKYANRERERRFLLAASPSGSGVRTVSITDRYLTGTRIRLRRSTEVTGSGENVVYQLTQKLLDPDGGPGLATTMYLTAEEHRAFARLPAALLNKTRLSVPPLGVDLFEGALDGLILAETEFPSDEAIADFTPPPTVVAEVTNDQRFTGGQLAIATRSDIATALSQYGITMPDQRPRARGQRPEARGQK